jgi:hypothetical protein
LTRENSVVGGVELGVDDRRGPDEEEDEPVPILLGIHDAPKRQETCGGARWHRQARMVTGGDVLQDVGEGTGGKNSVGKSSLYFYHQILVSSFVL